MSRTNIYTDLSARHYSKHQCVYTHTHTHTHTHKHTLIQSSHQSFGLTTSILQMKKERQIKVKLLSKADTQTVSREQRFKGRHHGFKITTRNYITLTAQEGKLQALAYFTDCCILLKDHKRVTLFTFH